MQVSILMPVFNTERYVAEAIESVLTQTYKNFEFIIINDGSVDRTPSIVESYANKDRRIRAVSHATNKGMGATLNEGLDLARNEWIVRMDADDIMLHNRVERQVAFVEENPDVAVAGTNVYYIDANRRIIGRSYSSLTSRDRVDKVLCRNEVIVLWHPSVIMRKSVVKQVGCYRPEFWPVDDLDLWNRIAENGHALLVQPEYLVKYRLHDSSSTSSSYVKARTSWTRVRWVEACMLSRRSGAPEPSWEDFLIMRRQAPWWRRLNQGRKDLANTLFIFADNRFSRGKNGIGNFSLFALTLFGVGLLRPSFILSRAARILI